ncbi:uncharacterized protein B0H64DRAFT_57862 [Chaetomium fimeti]|uniref:Uncharacterized protein n=1 Tax=Chaetomium fimeti TaxID=1854472 RepID=A0AAE0LM26_9PEZI|nr:hypothetical protein B0H64DRAFT_57862 [Chaetomium fimeti]
MGTPKEQPPPFTPGSPPATTTTTTTTTNNNTAPAGNPPPYQPPAYELRPDTTAPDPDELLDPCTLVIHGRFIYPLLPAPGSADPHTGEADSEPIYQLSRAIHEQGAAAERIEFQRLDLRIRNNGNDDPDAVAGPSLARRAKDVYWLEHRKPMVRAGIPFQAWLEPQTRKALGKVRVEKSPAFRTGYRANRVVSDAERRWMEREGKKVKKGEFYFVVKEKGIGGIGGGEWEWSDPEGRVVAVQVREAVDGEDTSGGEVFRLRLLVPLSRRMRDTLVALWCLWMWHIRIEENIPKRTWEDRKRIMQAGIGL